MFVHVGVWVMSGRMMHRGIYVAAGVNKKNCLFLLLTRILDLTADPPECVLWGSGWTLQC